MRLTSRINGKFYDRTNGVAFGWPLALVVVSLYMRNFRTTGSEDSSTDAHVAIHIRLWHRSLDSWQEEVGTLQKHFDNILSKLQIRNGNNRMTHCHPSMVWKRESPMARCHTVYRQTTHTDLFLHVNSYYPHCKIAVFSTFVRRAKSICDIESLDKKSYTSRAFSGRTATSQGHPWILDRSHFHNGRSRFGWTICRLIATGSASFWRAST
jgi:hypothetical protein